MIDISINFIFRADDPGKFAASGYSKFRRLFPGGNRLFVLVTRLYRCIAEGFANFPTNGSRINDLAGRSEIFCQAGHITPLGIHFTGNLPTVVLAITNFERLQLGAFLAGIAMINRR